MLTIPDEILKPKGLVGEIADYIHTNSYVPNRIVSYCGAICTMSYLMGARYRTPDDIFPGLYTILIGKTGSGKDSAFKLVKRMIKQLVYLKGEKDLSMHKLRKGVTQKISTRQGIEDKLCDMDERPDLFIEMDEVGRFLQNNERNEHGRSFCSLLVEQFNSDSLHLRNLTEGPNKKARPAVIDYPSFTVLGASNMMSIANGVGVELIADGFINRFLWFNIDQMQEPIRDSHVIVEPSMGLLNSLSKLTRIKGPGSGARRMTQCNLVKYADGAEKVFGDYDRMIRADDKFSENDLAFHTRVALQAKKLAIVYAVGEDRKNPIITVENAKQALGVARWCTLSTVEIINENIMDDRVYEVIKDIKAYLDRTVSSTIGCSIVSLINVPSYHRAKGIIKRDIQNEFFEIYGSQYGILTLAAHRAGRKTQVIYRLSKGEKCKMTHYLVLNRNLEKDQRERKFALTDEQLQQIQLINN